MSAKVSPEARILKYFKDATLPEAELVFGLVRGLMTDRRKAENPTVRTRRRTSKTTQTSVNRSNVNRDTEAGQSNRDVD